MTRRVEWWTVPACVVAGWLSCFAVVPAAAGQFPQVEKKRKVEKTDAEWRKQLTTMQYQVTRLKATEPAGTGKFAHSKAAGTYLCVGCDAPLFSSKTKFESGTGWPSFWQPVNDKIIDSERDMSAGTLRIEVMCNDCGAHLGHVFDDGPPPTGLRYCINSASLKFQAQGKAAPKKKGDPKADPDAEPDTEEKPAPKTKGKAADKDR